MTATVIVVGPQRTGTSMVASVLTGLGVNMGTHLMRSNPGNPTGYYEDLAFVKLNEEILNEAGGSWDDPPSEVRVNEAFAGFADRLSSLINARDNANDVWGWKDPRTSLLLHLYLGLVIREPRIVICTREKESAAQSLTDFSQAFEAKVSKRDAAIALAAEYKSRIRSAREEFPDVPTLTIDYDFVRRHPENATGFLSYFVGIGQNRIEAASRRIISQGIEHDYDSM